jgi:hypothetical protein
MPCLLYGRVLRSGAMERSGMCGAEPLRLGSSTAERIDCAVKRDRLGEKSCVITGALET